MSRSWDTCQLRKSRSCGNGEDPPSSQSKDSHPIDQEDGGWTITSSTWNHLSRRWTESESALADFIHDEATIQEKLESKGYSCDNSSPTWRLLRALQSIHGAVCVQGESAVTAPPFLQACRKRSDELCQTSGGTVEGGRRNRQSFYGKLSTIRGDNNVSKS